MVLSETNLYKNFFEFPRTLIYYENFGQMRIRIGKMNVFNSFAYPFFKMKPVRQITAAFLFLLFLLSSFPKELLHEFFHEHESTDLVCPVGTGDQLSIQHQHCEFLQLSHPPLYFTVENFSFSDSKLLFVLLTTNTQDYKYNTSPFLFFRGPPSLS